MITQETITALQQARAEVDHLVDSATDDIITAWLHALKETQAEIRRVIEENPEDTLDRIQHLEASEHAIAQRITDAANKSTARLTAEAERMVAIAGGHQEAMIATQLPPGAGISFTRPDPDALEAIVRRTTQQITVRNYYLSADATKAMQSALRLGVSGGQNPTEVAQRMVDAVDGAFHGGIGRATVIARTEMLDANREAALETRKANNDILECWEWWAQLDSSRTCISCIAQHGTRHPVDEPGPLDHHQGRCAAMPATKTWRELGFDIDEPEELKTQTGVEWFNSLDEKQQQNILGPKRYEAWKDGRFPPEMWSQRRSSKGWRDAYHVGKPLETDADSPHDVAHSLTPNMRKTPSPEDVAEGIRQARGTLEQVHGEEFVARHWVEPEIRPLPIGQAGARDSKSIRISNRAKFPKTTLLHEFGHELDATLLTTAERERILSEIRNSETYSRLISAIEADGPSLLGVYLVDQEELVARSYAQWVVQSAADETGLNELRKLSRAGALNRYRQWPVGDFRHIMEVFNTIFRR